MPKMYVTSHLNLAGTGFSFAMTLMDKRYRQYMIDSDQLHGNAVYRAGERFDSVAFKSYSILYICCNLSVTIQVSKSQIGNNSL